MLYRGHENHPKDSRDSRRGVHTVGDGSAGDYPDPTGADSGTERRDSQVEGSACGQQGLCAEAYKQSPGPEKKAELQERFDEIFTTHTCYEALNQALKRIHKNKPELLMVLERPDVPLHNNTSETDIREYVKKRKISGSTRSDLGRRCRDTFTSLKKTCRKLGIGFWQYLEDRVSRRNSIPSLPDLMRLRVRESPG